MSEADQIFDELHRALSRWGLSEIPFSESASTLRASQLRDVFTGRTQELRDALALFQGRDRKRLLVYGWVGIGKTAFILELLVSTRNPGSSTRWCPKNRLHRLRRSRPKARGCKIV